ncbi:MAG: PleD family two-component response regulator [Pseudohongiellaceae bacterium]|jgi:PleD family two-component response regulator
MQGDIRLHSEYQKGSRFSFELYLPIAEKKINESKIDANIKEDNVVSAYIPQKLLNKKALLVEDMEINRLVAQSILGQAGIIVEFAVNGLEAVNMAEINNYALIVMELQMPCQRTKH